MAVHRTPEFLRGQAIAMARLVAARVTADPARALLVIQDNLARWLPNMGPHTVPLMQPWIEAAYDADAIVRLLLAEEERADQLRKVAPTAGILTEAERLGCLREFAENAMAAQIKRAVLAGTTWYRGDEIATQAQTAGVRSVPDPSEWLAQRRIFALELDGALLFPGYALEPRTWDPWPVLPEVLAILMPRRHTWSLAGWFESINSYLGGVRPRELLASNPARVMLSAQADVEGINHG